MSVITVPPVLGDKLGTDGAQALVDLINASQIDFKEDIIEICEDRFETRLTREISNLRVELLQKMADLETRLTRQITELDARHTQQSAELETRLIRELQNGRTETLKWVLLFWVGQFAVLIGVLFAFFKH